MTEEVCCEMIPDRRAEFYYSRERGRDHVRPGRLTQFAVVVSLTLSCAALLLNQLQHKAANNQHVSGGAETTGVQNLLGNASALSPSDSEQQQHAATIPSAHLTAPRSFNNSKREYLEWEDHFGHVHLSEFKYHDGDLIVPRDGIYKVYLQITFRRPGNFQCDTDVFILTQKVLLYAANYPENVDLLAASDIVYCMPNSEEMPYWEKSPNTSGVFKLNAGDKLRVKNGNRFHELMLLQEDKTFFGAHLI
ncbi:tumor necrosis factor [Esox lucius]|uniref:tumor necrosis factor n=1 Tax=Esox lucius TaxID=8010 RepID=UPI0014768682|nr:tumor necrosis factor [Esox lucius]